MDSGNENGDLDDIWMKFMENTINENNLSQSVNQVISEKDKINSKENIPKCGPLYISTQTKLSYLNVEIPIYDLFWKLPII